jgi:hypothetical protein
MGELLKIPWLIGHEIGIYMGFNHQTWIYIYNIDITEEGWLIGNWLFFWEFNNPWVVGEILLSVGKDHSFTLPTKDEFNIKCRCARLPYFLDFRIADGA